MATRNLTVTGYVGAVVLGASHRQWGVTCSELHCGARWTMRVLEPSCVLTKCAR
jgi:hypothetical protein